MTSAALLAACVALSGNAPGYSDTNYAVFEPTYADVSSSVAGFTEKQFATPGIESYDGGCATTQSFGFGTYAFDGIVEPGASSLGFVAEAFLYLPGSQTEIDIELWGSNAYFTNWTSETTYVQTPIALDSTVWHHYAFTWTQDAVAFFVDGTQVAVHRTYVPTQPAPFRFDVHGTNNPNWGGAAVPGSTVHFVVKNATYTND